MRLDPTLTRASRLARSGKYEAALRVLQPEVTRYGRSFNYHYLMGAVCLHAGDFGGAMTYLRLARELKGRDPSTIVGLAALYLARNDASRAVDLYLEALEIDPGNRTARNAMRVIRRHAGADELSAWRDSGRLPSLYPPIPFAGPSARAVAAAAGGLALLLAFVLGALVQTGLLADPLRPMGSREIPPGLRLTREDRRSPIAPGGPPREFMLSQSQAVEIYERALALFSSHRDEAARVYLNRILESNASEGIRNRASRMLLFMDPPRFDNFRRGDNVDFHEAWQDPLLYRGVHVIWRGVASNASVSSEGTSFDLLVGRDSPRIVEGIVPVEFAGAVPVPDGQVEVLGRVAPIDASPWVMLEGIGILRVNP